MKSVLPTNPNRQEKIKTKGFEDVPELLSKIMDEALIKNLSLGETVELVHSRAKEWRSKS